MATSSLARTLAWPCGRLASATSAPSAALARPCSAAAHSARTARTLSSCSPPPPPLPLPLPLLRVLLRLPRGEQNRLRRGLLHLLLVDYVDCIIAREYQ